MSTHQHIDSLTGHPDCTFGDWLTVINCSHPGDCADDIKAALEHGYVSLDLIVDECRVYLDECGAWEDLEDADEDTIAQRIV